MLEATVVAVKHVAMQTEAMDLAQIFLEVVFRFRVNIGRMLAQQEHPGIIVAHFVTDPYIVKLALEVWLLDGADLPESATVLPMLAVCLRDVEDRPSEEELHSLTQWSGYVRILQRRRRG
jgi:hypothetical protein